MHTFIQKGGPSIGDVGEEERSEKPPPQQNKHDEPDAGERPVLRHN